MAAPGVTGGYQGRLGTVRLLKGHSSVGRAAVSKTVGRGFESYCPCHVHMEASQLRRQTAADAVRSLTNRPDR